MKAEVINKIEVLLQSILQALERAEPLAIALNQRPKSHDDRASTPRITVITFPGDTPNEAWRFSWIHAIQRFAFSS